MFIMLPQLPLYHSKYLSTWLKIGFLVICFLHILLAEHRCDESSHRKGDCDPRSFTHSNTENKYRFDMSEMKSVRVDEFGDESKLKVVTQSVPVPKEDEVLIKVEAIGVNPVELMIRKGMFGDMVKVPYVPGTDVAGTVEEVGSKVTKFKRGDRVFAIKASSGAYAQFVSSPADFVRPLHSRLSFSQGAALGLPYTVAYKALFIRAQGKKGDTVLVHGASGGVGVAAVQMAKEYGLTVIGTAGSEEGMALVKGQGADFVLNHKEQGYMDKVKEMTPGGKGVDIILEMLANKNLVSDLGVVAHNGRIVVIGNKGSIPEFNPSLTMGSEANIMGMVVQISTQSEYQEMLDAIDKGQGSWVNPQIAREYSLERVADAHADLDKYANSKGKIILNPKL